MIINMHLIIFKDGDGQEQAVAVMTGDGIEQAVAALHTVNNDNIINNEHITPDHHRKFFIFCKEEFSSI